MAGTCVLVLVRFVVVLVGLEDDVTRCHKKDPVTRVAARNEEASGALSPGSSRVRDGETKSGSEADAKLGGRVGGETRFKELRAGGPRDKGLASMPCLTRTSLQASATSPPKMAESVLGKTLIQRIMGGLVSPT